MRFSIPALVALVAVAASSAAAQQAPAPVQVTTNSVSRVTLFQISPGQGPAYNQDVVDNLIPVYEEFKKAGMIVDYNFFGKVTTESRDDWNTGIVLTYPNYAALDGFFMKAGPITLRHYGSAEKRTAAGAARGQLRTVVSSFLTSNFSFSR
jgi:hypothetical protein